MGYVHVLATCKISNWIHACSAPKQGKYVLYTSSLRYQMPYVPTSDSDIHGYSLQIPDRIGTISQLIYDIYDVDHLGGLIKTPMLA